MFPQDVLKEIILSYNNTAQKFMPEILSKTFEVFHQQQQSFLKAFNAPAEENKSSESSAVFFEEWQKSQAEIMEKMMQPWLNNPLFKEKTSEEPSNSNVSKDNSNVEEMDSLRQQIEELRDIITKKNP